MSSGHKWRPLQRTSLDVSRTPREVIETIAKTHGWTFEEVSAYADKLDRDCEYWVNDLYQVEVRRDGVNVHLNIRRRDGYPGRDWRHFQQIKNELVGPECEAVEIYPAESRLVDAANKYHLWACADPTFRFPIGFQGERQVSADDERTRAGVSGGLRQRPSMQFANASGAKS